MLVKKVTYFGNFGYMNRSCIRKSIMLIFLSSSKDKFAFLAKLSDRCFCWFPVAMLVSIQHQHPCISSVKKNNGCDLNLGESFCIFTFFLFSDSGLDLDLLNGFDFILIYSEWRDTENKQ